MQQFVGRLKSNWQSGLTVALVSIPLSISLAIASGATPIMGIITAIWAGLIAAIFGGSNYNVIGPAGALTGILAAYALIYGFETLPMVALVAGGIILIAWLLRLDRYMVFVPGSTIYGFTLGVAIIIALNQLNTALGLVGLPKHKEFIDNVLESLKHLGQGDPLAFIVFLVFFGSLVVLAKLLPKIPGAIVVAPIGIIFGYLTTTSNFLGLNLATIGSTFPNLQTSLVILPKFGFNEHIIISGMAVAFVAILETMLAAKIADGMTKTIYNERKEMLGLGLANIASGMAGGLPATGVLVRTSLNVKSGANHKTSSGLNAIFVALISLVLFGWFSYIPMAVIAAILVFAAMRMVEVEHFKRYFVHDKIGFILALVVAAVTVYKDPTVGLIFGTAASLLVFMDKLSLGQFEAVANNHEGVLYKLSDEKMKDTSDRDESDHILVYSIKGQLAYINSQSHLARFRAGLNGYRAVILRLRELYFIDLDGVDALAEIIDIIQAAGVKVAISGINDAIAGNVAAMPEFKELKEKGLVFAKTEGALDYLKKQS